MMMGANRKLEKIDDLTHGYWRSRVLFAGVELGVFNALAGEAKSADELAGELACDQRAMEILLGALAGLELLCKEGDRFSLTAELREALVPGAPHDQSAILTHLALMWDAWGRLDQVVRSGRPADRPDRPDAAQAAAFRVFIEGMHQRSRDVAELFAVLPRVAATRRMLDVGGGPGTYCIAMALRHEGLRATVLDRAAALDVARGHIGEAGLAGRIELREGDALNDDYGGDFDLALMSQLLHAYGPEDCRRLVGKGARALVPGGLLAVNEFALEEDGVHPPQAALFAVNMLVNTDHGRTYRVSELRAMMNEASLEDAGAESLAGRSTLVFGRRPR